MIHFKGSKDCFGSYCEIFINLNFVANIGENHQNLVILVKIETRMRACRVALLSFARPNFFDMTQTNLRYLFLGLNLKSQINFEQYSLKNQIFKA